MSNQIETNFTLSNGQTQVMVYILKGGSFNVQFLSVDGIEERYNTIESNQKTTITLKDKEELKWLANFLLNAHDNLNPPDSTNYSGRII